MNRILGGGGAQNQRLLGGQDSTGLNSAQLTSLTPNNQTATPESSGFKPRPPGASASSRRRPPGADKKGTATMPAEELEGSAAAARGGRGRRQTVSRNTGRKQTAVVADADASLAFVLGAEDVLGGGNKEDEDDDELDFVMRRTSKQAKTLDSTRFSVAGGSGGASATTSRKMLMRGKTQGVLEERPEDSSEEDDVISPSIGIVNHHRGSIVKGKVGGGGLSSRPLLPPPLPGSTLPAEGGGDSHGSPTVPASSPLGRVPKGSFLVSSGGVSHSTALGSSKERAAVGVPAGGSKERVPVGGKGGNNGNSSKEPGGPAFSCSGSSEEPGGVAKTALGGVAEAAPAVVVPNAEDGDLSVGDAVFSDELVEKEVHKVVNVETGSVGLENILRGNRVGELARAATMDTAHTPCKSVPMIGTLSSSDDEEDDGEGKEGDTASAGLAGGKKGGRVSKQSRRQTMMASISSLRAKVLGQMQADNNNRDFGGGGSHNSDGRDAGKRGSQAVRATQSMNMNMRASQSLYKTWRAESGGGEHGEGGDHSGCEEGTSESDSDEYSGVGGGGLTRRTEGSNLVGLNERVFALTASRWSPSRNSPEHEAFKDFPTLLLYISRALGVYTSVFRDSFYSSCVLVFVKLYDSLAPEPVFRTLLPPHANLVTIFTGVLGFTLVFRINLAYARWYINK